MQQSTLCRAVTTGLLVLLLCVISIGPAAADGLNPYPSPPVVDRLVREWGVSRPIRGWTISQQLQLTNNGDILRLQSTGEDPILLSPTLRTARGAAIVVTLSMRTTADGPLQLFWSSDVNGNTSEERSVRLATRSDGRWHEYRATLDFEGRLTRLRLDPVREPGLVEIDWIRIRERIEHPLEIESVEVKEGEVSATVRNRSPRTTSFRIGSESHRLEPQKREQVAVARRRGARFFEPVTVTLDVSGAPELSRTSFVIDHSALEPAWESIVSGPLRLDVAGDGSGARLLRSGRLVACLAPLAWQPGHPQELQVSRIGESITCSGGVVEELVFSFQEEELNFRLRARSPVEGPVVRAVGRLEQGLLAGVEHLGHGESSSSSIDIEGPRHVRFAPDPLQVTMPLMAFVTDAGSVAMTWSEMTLEPTFATPNFFDGTADHRMSLQGETIAGSIRVGGSFAEGERLEEAILWAVGKQGEFPGLPPTGRTRPKQRELSKRGFTQSAIKATGGWYHAVVPGGRTIPEKPAYFADVASTLFRLTGEIPDGPRLVRGGAHINNEIAYFLTGRAEAWRDELSKEVERILKQQQPDGSFRYNGPFRKGHFEDTASGHCAERALKLLQYAHYTGNRRVLNAGVRALEFMQRFRTPRGAQLWECPLHAPDLLASAWLVKCYVRGYELTGKQKYLDAAVRWAVSGVPYVYQWSDRPIMHYATTPTLCASNFRTPVWIGQPVQWVGIVYADALVDLIPHDRTLNWHRLASGILRCGEQQQYTEGPTVGCLADSLSLKLQRLNPADINPATLVNLRRRLLNQPAGLSVAENEQHRVVAPFPVTIQGNEAQVESQAGLRYQVLIDGSRIREVRSVGMDVVLLE